MKPITACLALCLATCQGAKDFADTHEIGAAFNVDAWEIILNHKPYKLTPVQK